MTNQPLDRASEFDTVTLQGDLPPGWEVELHVNGVLRDFRVADAAGRYGFEEIGLLVGQNELRLLFFGPEGQRREEVRRILVGPGAVEPGRVQYRLAVTDDRKAVIDVERDAVRRTDADEGFRAVAEVEYGVSRDLSASIAAAHLPLADEARTYLALGLLGQMGGILGRCDLALDDEGGLGWLLGSQSRLGPLSFALEHAQFERDFQSEEAGAGDLRLASRSEARVDASFRAGGVPLGLGVAARLERETDGRRTVIAQARAASVLGRVAAASEVTLIDQEGGQDGGQDERRIDGVLRLSGQPDWPGQPFLLAELDYGIWPDFSSEAIDLSADFALADDGNLRLGLRQDIRGEDERRWSVGYSRRFDQVRLGVGVDYDEAGELFFGVSLGLSLMRDPASGWPVVVADSLSSSGAAAPMVFVDHDLDGVFGAKDQPVENAEFTLAGRRLDAVTDATGRTVLTGLDPNRAGNLSIREGSLEDPYWVPAKEGYGLVSRPGVIPVLTFPVVTTGEVDGTVEILKDGAEKPAANVALQLIGADGEVAHEARSSYDGFYLFEKVRPGRYTLRADPAQLRRLGLASGESAVELSGEGDIVSGRDILLRPAATDASF